MVLLGFLLTGLFNVFRQGLKNSISAKELKQKVLQLELFQQRMKILFTHKNDVWLEQHPDAIGNGLCTTFEQKVDPEFDMCGNMQGMLYRNDKKQLCFVSWSEKGKARVEILLDNVEQTNFSLFDTKKAEWMESWSKDKKGTPNMVSVKLQWGKNPISFVFFLIDPDEHITYRQT